MKTKVNIDGKEIELMLTSDQIKEVEVQRSSVLKFSDIISHEIACEFLGRNHRDIPDFSMRPEEQRQSLIDEIKLMDIANAIRKADNNHKPTAGDWFPYFYNSGFRFVFSCCVHGASSSDVGSRLCYRFRTKEQADFFGRQFNDLHVSVLSH